MSSDCKSDRTKGTTLPITRPVFDTTEEDAVCNVLRSGWVVQGPRVAEFERLFREFVGTRHAIAASSCTAALHLALTAAGIGPGDEVLLPSFTFVASANAVEYTGARPVFVDIDLDGFTIDPVRLDECLQGGSHKQARCIMPVSLFGLCADLEAINRLASEHDLLVIEDAACGLGARRDGHHAGTEALAGCFSFHPRKTVTTGEGGMVITNDDRLAEQIRKMRDHGASRTDLERHLSEGGSLLPEYNTLGYNYRMTDLQGAVGAVQMAKAEKMLNGRAQVARRYDKLLRDVPFLKAPSRPDGYLHAYQSYVCLYGADSHVLERAGTPDWDEISRLNRERNWLMARLEKEGISVRQGTHAVHTLGFYKNKYRLMDYDCPKAFIADRLSIALPLYYGMTGPEQRRVVDALLSAYQSVRASI